MFRRVIDYLLKKLYRRTMLDTVVLDKENYRHYDRLETFCELRVMSSTGVFLFLFKEDRRKRVSRKWSILSINGYVIELIPPNGLTPVNIDLNKKILLVIRFIVLKPNYRILTEVLVDMYLDSMLSYRGK